MNDRKPILQYNRDHYIPLQELLRCDQSELGVLLFGESYEDQATKLRQLMSNLIARTKSKSDKSKLDRGVLRYVRFYIQAQTEPHLAKDLGQLQDRTDTETGFCELKITLENEPRIQEALYTGAKAATVLYAELNESPAAHLLDATKRELLGYVIDVIRETDSEAHADELFAFLAAPETLRGEKDRAGARTLLGAPYNEDWLCLNQWTLERVERLLLSLGKHPLDGPDASHRVKALRYLAQGLARTRLMFLDTNQIASEVNHNQDTFRDMRYHYGNLAHASRVARILVERCNGRQPDASASRLRVQGDPNAFFNDGVQTIFLRVVRAFEFDSTEDEAVQKAKAEAFEAEFDPEWEKLKALIWAWQHDVAPFSVEAVLVYEGRDRPSLSRYERFPMI